MCNGKHVSNNDWSFTQRVLFHRSNLAKLNTFRNRIVDDSRTGCFRVAHRRSNYSQVIMRIVKYQETLRTFLLLQRDNAEPMQSRGNFLHCSLHRSVSYQPFNEYVRMCIQPARRGPRAFIEFHSLSNIRISFIRCTRIRNFRCTKICLSLRCIDVRFGKLNIENNWKENNRKIFTDFRAQRFVLLQR